MAAVYDANATLLADAVRELGCQPVPLGIVGDDEEALEEALERGLAAADVVLLSGGTSKGSGRPLLPRAGSPFSGHHGARRGPQARQADLPGGGGDDPGGDLAGLSDLGDLHVP